MADPDDPDLPPGAVRLPTGLVRMPEGYLTQGPPRRRPPPAHRMELIICGASWYADELRVRQALDRAHALRRITQLSHRGGKEGIDAWASAWAAEHGIRCLGHRADPHYAPYAEKQRDFAMSMPRPDGVIALPTDEASEQLIEAAQIQGAKVWRPYG